MIFSPITERSPRIRLLYFTIYLLLAGGALTMIFPFLIMIAGSLEPYPRPDPSLFPKYLVSDDAMWESFVQVKYGGEVDQARAAWSDPDFEFRNVGSPGSSGEKALLHWDEFLRKTRPDPEKFLLAFLQPSNMPSYSVRSFRQWLSGGVNDNLAKLNSDLGTRFEKVTMIRPPSLGLIGPPLAGTPLVRKYFEFLDLQVRLRMPANAGGYYRSVFLPARFGYSLASFNEKYGVSFNSWGEIPFTDLAPEIGRAEWSFFACQLLRPNFVELTPEGEQARAVAGMTKNEFIRTLAQPEHVRITTVDLMFAEWMERKHGVTGALIPARSLDERQFREEKTFWRFQFLTLNYQRVLDEILLHGHAFSNTAILVLLFVVGALTVNPLAAYALSRFKLRQTYSILVFCLATISFPAEVLMIPVFLQLKEFHLLNTFGALVIPSLANGFSIFLLKGFFDSLPRELYEAAELDGASGFVMFWHITMNLSKPILAVIALGAFTSAYGTFFYALILAPDPRLWTVMVYIFQLQSAVASPVVYASLILVSIPTLLVFVFCQNIILRGIVVPSDK